jgi:hypothetical protein
VAWASIFVRPAPAVRTGLANKSDFNVDWALNSIFAWALVICVLVMSSSRPACRAGARKHARGRSYGDDCGAGSCGTRAAQDVAVKGFCASRCGHQGSNSGGVLGFTPPRPPVQMSSCSTHAARACTDGTEARQGQGERGSGSRGGRVARSGRACGRSTRKGAEEQQRRVRQQLACKQHGIHASFQGSTTSSARRGTAKATDSDAATLMTRRAGRRSCETKAAVGHDELRGDAV